MNSLKCSNCGSLYDANDTIRATYDRVVGHHRFPTEDEVKASDETTAREKDTKNYKIVGRSSEIDLEKYSVTVHGREIIDYEKLRVSEPELYKKILDNELEIDRIESIESDYLLDEYSILGCAECDNCGGLGTLQKT